MIPRLLGAVSAVLMLAGCSVVPGSSSYRHMTAYFPKTTAFYEQSHVKIMGVDVGTVDKITIQGGRVRVDFSVRDDVPVPADVQASIVPLNLVGERNLVLSPAWTPGTAKASNGLVIPENRTHVPVEVDDALQGFTNLANALDPAKVNKAVGNTANSFKGNGNAFNEALQQTGDLATNIASQNDQLLQVAQNLNTLAGVVRGREQTLGTLIQNFSTASQVFADERTDIQSLVNNTLVLLKDGGKLLDKYQGNLPSDLAVLTRVALVLQGNYKSVGQLIHALPNVSGAFIGAYDKKNKSIAIRFALDAFLRIWIKGLTRNDNTPCPLPAPNSNCPFSFTGSTK
jgi:virulence factor Mce-like protein